MSHFFTFGVRNLGYARQQHVLFDSLCFSLQPGEMLCVHGANGTGKSTLLRILAGLTTPTNGHVERDPATSLHYVGHMNGLKLGLTVSENLRLIAQLAQTPLTVCSDVLVKIKLDVYHDKIVKTLSAGQKRRIALAKLLMIPRPIWILDEPLTALDKESQDFFLDQIQMHLQNKGVVIISTHQPLPLSSTSTLLLRRA
ncbi:MAG TPA: heme ABC exporter ATP-binding protein CcmA [Gammaproteobacteria bacterium]|jgi:heme exporter protein A|nr:heme ABC exporter ATP-binding protein CcmA [Gammaproteobacteria bacterium]